MYQRWQFKCTRIDIAVDDPDKQLDYQHIIQATKDKNISGFQEGKYIESYGGDTPGMTVYCGARRSAKYARFYNKGDVDRFEIEFKLDLAHTIFIDYISSDTTRSSRLLATCLKSAISFIDKKDKNISRNTVFPWWESFISRIEGDCIKLPRVRIESSIERSMSWIQKSVSKTILKCKAALGAAEFQFNLDIWVADATQRITRLDNLHVMEYRQRVACCV
jgi:DNA relaxase NicK